MATSVIVQYTRAPETSPEEFKRYMEENHIPLMREALGIHFPASFPRRYLARVESGAGDRLGLPRHSDGAAPVCLVGTPGEINFDMWGEMIFRDELHMQQCLVAMNSDAGQLVKDDEENFTASHLLKVILVGDRIEG
ncbi:hypothetical protein HBI75_202180 [Parastagonospora nodorum]|nr:hypothetical protein HBI75_202180 [Parastagonospora nodorum]